MATVNIAVGPILLPEMLPYHLSIVSLICDHILTCITSIVPKYASPKVLMYYIT